MHNIDERDARTKRMMFRAWHRGTREADCLIGGFFERFHQGWGETECVWFEALLDEDDADILGWALGTAPVPERYAGPMLVALQRLDYAAPAR